MYYEVYLDFYFLENLFMDGALLVLTGMVMKSTMKKKRIFLAAFLGSVVSVGVLLCPVKNFFLAAAVQLLSAFGMVKCGFEKCSRITQLKGTAALYLMSFLTGGAMQALAGRTGLQRAVLTGAAVFSIGGLLSVYRMMQKHTEVRRTVSVTLHGKSRQLEAFYDTGNRLREPYGHRPVNIVEYQAVKELLKAEDSFFLIPCRTVNGGSRMLEGMVFERMVVSENGRTKEIKHPVIAFAKESISSDGSYQMILHPDNSDD